FRPTDIKLGPDGALYVADFYNKIIGHYEVDLKHPQRDKDRGRVWRIVWKGEGAKPPAMPFKDLTTEPIEKVHRAVGSRNLTVRLLATLQMQRREDEFVRYRSKQLESGAFRYSFEDNAFGIAHTAWFGRHSDGQSPAGNLGYNLSAARTNPNPNMASAPALEVHLMRRAASFKTWEPTEPGDVPLRGEVLRLLLTKE